MLSLFLAKVLGVYIVLVCLSVLMNRKRFAAMAERGAEGLPMYASGAIILILGLLMVNTHNIWTSDYRGVITFMGWLTIFKGAVRLFAPHKAVEWGRSAFHAAWYTPLVIIFLLLGLWLTATGYGLM